MCSGLCILYSVHISRKLEPNATVRSGSVCRSQKREGKRSTEVTGCNWPPPCFLFPRNFVCVSSLRRLQLDPVSYESFALAAGHARIWSHANFRFLSGNCSHLSKLVTLLVLNCTEMYKSVAARLSFSLHSAINHTHIFLHKKVSLPPIFPSSAIHGT